MICFVLRISSFRSREIRQLLKETRVPIDGTKNHARRLEFRLSPKHGSWLNVAENEPSSLTRQCFKGRCIGDLETLRAETDTWACVSNDNQRGVEWQFQIDDARIERKSLYPCYLY